MVQVGSDHLNNNKSSSSSTNGKSPVDGPISSFRRGGGDEGGAKLWRLLRYVVRLVLVTPLKSLMRLMHVDIPFGRDGISRGLSSVAAVAGLVLSLALGAMEWLVVFPLLALALLLFVVFDGYKAAVIFVKTLPRDLKGAFRLSKVLFHINRCQRKNITITKLFSENVAKFPDKVCIIMGEQRWTFKQLDEFSNRVANAFRERGYKPGDQISVFMENRPEYIGVWLGLAKASLIPALINFNLRHQPLMHCILVVSSKAVVYGDELGSAMADVHGELKKESKVPLTFFRLKSPGTTHEVPASIASSSEDLDSLLAACPSSLTAKDQSNFQDRLLYIYTSGTTGMPKAAIITNSRFLFFTGGIHHFVGLGSNEIIYDPLPLYHTAGGMIGTGQLLAFGCTLVLRQRFSATAYWADAKKYNCTVAQYIGEICRYLLSTPPRPDDTQHKVRIMFGNGLRPQIWEPFQKRFGVPNICEFYGATEGNANIVNITNKVGAVGFISRILPWIYPVTLIRLDEETGEPLRDKNGLCIRCKPGEAGEFIGRIIRNHPLRDFEGYADKKANKSKIVENVWKKGDFAFRSGDILMMDNLGYFYFLDRTGDTFRWKGENVSTAEVEAVVSNVCGLTDAVSYGVEIPDIEGRAGMVAIYDPTSSTDLSALADGMVKTLPAYARPLFVRLVKELDMTGTYKLKKLDLQKEGYNPVKITDPLFFFDGGKYVPLDNDLYERIVTGKVRV